MIALSISYVQKSQEVMDRDLAAYRAKKQQEQLNKPASKEVLTALISLSDQSRSGSSSSSSNERHRDLQDQLSNSSAIKSGFFDKYDIYLYWTSVVLKCLLWCSLMVLAVKFEFGSVFFILSLFYLIAVNLRTRPKQEGELSAYSVFNPKFEQLDGTLTAEQFERELVYGAVSMRG